MDDTIMRERLDPELRGAFDLSPGFDLEHLDTFVAAANKAELAALKDDPEVVVYDTIIPGPEDNPELKIRVYKPAGRTEEVLPCGMFFHGGGFLFGSVYRQNDLCNRYSKNAGCAIVSVEYRLAPQHKGPAPVEDAYAALLWIDAHAEELKIDRNKIALIGISAGANIAAALALMTRDRKGPQPIIQMPLYAELDYRMETASAKEITSRKIWSYPYSQISWDAYLDKGKPVDYYTSPSLAEDLTGLPPLFSYVGTLDPFRDENIEYWNRLMKAGIPVEAHVYPGGFHSFEVSVPNAEVSKAAYEATYAALRRAFR